MKKILWSGERIVVKGDGVSGSVYHLPTANFQNDGQLPVKEGVFVGKVSWGKKSFDAVLVYGIGSPPKFEAHLIGFEGDLVGQAVNIELYKKISELIPWVSVERMRQKILHDMTLALDYFKQT